MYMILILLILLTFTNAYYNETIAKMAVDLSQSAYCISDVNIWNCTTCNSGAKLEFVVENKGVRALQGYQKEINSIFTAFRGSSNINNWINNIEIRKISPYNDSKIAVARGFYNEYQYVKQALLENIYSLSKKYNTNKLLITGHSSGAACATIMVYDINVNNKDLDMAYFFNFGSPRVGNKNFANSFNNITAYRITHYYDMVPHIPEEFLGFQHIQREIWYNKDNTNYEICKDTEQEDNSCSNSCAPLHCTSTSDHLNYLNVSMGSADKEVCI